MNKTLRKSRKSPGYSILTDEMIEQFTEITKRISESIAKDQTREMILDPKIINTLKYVESFVSKHRLVVYGGTALNAVLPLKDRFYSPEYDLPDWDFFSDNPVHHAIAIADEVHKKTGSETFVTTAAHHGTYKVYADGVSIADITHVDTELLEVLRTHSLKRDNILYSGPDYLRMAAYLELSRPRGQVDRWEKVMKRLSLVNRAHPIQTRDYKTIKPELSRPIRTSILRELVALQGQRRKGEEEFAFFGPECIDLVRRSVGRDGRKRAPEFSVPRYGLYPMLLSATPHNTVRRVVSALKTKDILGEDGTIDFTKHEGRGEFLPSFYEIRLGKKGPIMCLVIGTSNGCQSVYRIPARVPIENGSKKTTEIVIASIESCLYMFLSIRFSKILPVPASAILKMCDTLVHLHYRAFIEMKEPILPLPTKCIGAQETLYDMRKERQKALKKIFKKRGWKSSSEYYLWNIRYTGGDESLRNTILRALKKQQPKRKYNKTVKRKASHTA